MLSVAIVKNSAVPKRPTVKQIRNSDIKYGIGTSAFSAVSLLGGLCSLRDDLKLGLTGVTASLISSFASYCSFVNLQRPNNDIQNAVDNGFYDVTEDQIAKYAALGAMIG